MKKGDQSLSTTLTLTVPAIVFSIFDMFVGCRHSRVEERGNAIGLLAAAAAPFGFVGSDSPALSRHKKAPLR